MASNLLLFVSHSGQDVAFARSLIELIRSALNLRADAIRCTSVDGYRLPGGANIHEQLRTETQEAAAFIGVISPSSIASLYVAFELGARWVSGKRLFTILAPGVGPEIIQPPLDVLNALRGDSREQLHQMIYDLGEHLDVTPSQPHTYGAQMERLLAIQAADFGSQSSGPKTFSWSAFLSKLKMIGSENGRLKLISDCVTRLPKGTAFAQIVPLLHLIRSEEGRLRATKDVLALFEPPTGEQEETEFLSLFGSENGRRRAMDLMHRMTDRN